MKKESFALRLRAWLNELPIENPIERRMASLLQVILIGLLVVVVIATMVLVADPDLDGPGKLNVLRDNFFGFVVVVLPLSLLRRGYFRISALIIITILLLTPALAVTVVFDLPNSGGILIQFTLAIILSGLLVGRRMLVLVFGLSAALVAFSAFQGQNAEPRLARLSLETAINFVLFNGLIALFLDRFGITLRTALTDSLARGTELQREITDREQAEARFRLAIEAAPNAILMIDQHGQIVLANPLAEKYFGYSHEGLIGANVDTLVPKSIRSNHTGFRAGFMESPQARPMGIGRDLYGLRKDSTVFPVEIGLAPIKTSDGLLIMATVVDITERKRAEEEIRKLNQELEQRVLERTAELSQANALLNAMLDNVPDHIFFKDHNSRFLRNSRSQALMMGLSDPAEVVGKSDFDFFPHAQRAFHEEQEIMQTGRPIVDLEEHVVWPDGRVTWVSTTKVPLQDPDGKIVGLFGIARDITDRKHTEESLRKAKEQTESANKELEAFCYSVSHDLRAPLRAIDGFTRILLEDYEPKLDTEGKRLFSVVRSEAQRMGQLIDDLLTFSRLGRTEMKFAPVDMQTMVGKIFNELTTSENQARIDFRLEELPATSGDPTLLRQVWVNLLSNALKFTSARARAVIEVQCTQTNGEIIYQIRDNGAGFDMNYADKLFGVFQRLHSEKDFEGTGVGLAIVQRVILRHGGRVWGEGKVDEGATFYFALPRKGATS